MTEKKNWLLETGKPFMEYHDPKRNPRYKAIWDAFEAGEDLAEKFPGLARKLNDPFPEQLHTDQMYKDPAVKVLKADADGTIEIGPGLPLETEADAVMAFWIFYPQCSDLYFNEKYGRRTPKAVTEALKKMEIEAKEAAAGSRRYSDEGRLLGVIQ